jgi:glycosyltransferase involved in cell wall biosynthesis
MDILHVVHGYYPALGGTERLMQRISENLVARYGDRLQVFTTNGLNAQAFVDRTQPLLPPGDFDLNGVRVRRFPVINAFGRPLNYVQRLAYRIGLPGNQYLRTLYGGPIVPKLGRCVRSFHGDVVAAAAFPLLHMYTTQRACQRAKKPLVFIGALHPLDAWGYDRSMIYRAIRQADAYIALSTYERDFLVSHWYVPQENIRVIGVGVDLERFRLADGAQVRERYALGDDPLVAYIGQHGRHKGIDTLVSAMKCVWQEIPDARLLIAGASTSFTPQIEKTIRTELTPDEQKQVVCLGNFDEDDKPHLFAACDVFAYPSRFESFGIAFIEAWAAGKPVIGCRSGAVPSIVGDGVDGVLVPPEDPTSLGQAIVRMLESPGLRKRMAQAGHEKVQQRYTWDIVTPRWRDVYECVLDVRNN